MADPLQLVMMERARQDRLWGANRNLPDLKWLAVLTEEVGEVAKAILGSPESVSLAIRNELVETCAVALAWLEAIERR